MAYFEQHLKPLYCLARFFGIFHFNLHKRHNNKISTWIFGNVWSIPYLTYSLMLSIIQINSLLKKFSKVGSKFKQITIITVCCGKIFLDYVWYISKRKKLEFLLQKIDQIYRKSNLNFDKSLKYHFIFVVAFAILWTISTTTDLIKSLPATLVCSNQVIFIAISNFINYTITKTVKDLFSHNNNRIIDLKCDLNVGDIIATIKKCMEIHFKLAKLSRQLNNVFSFPLLGNTFALFFLIIPFTFHVIVKINLKGSSNQIYEIMGYLLSIVLIIFQLIIQIFSWDSLAKEENKTGLIVHKYWNQFQEKTEAPRWSNLEIDTISLQLLHNKLEFTICRFSNLNWSLMHLIVQTTTTYLIWILQLRV